MDFSAMTDYLLMAISIIMIKLQEMSSYSGESKNVFIKIFQYCCCVQHWTKSKPSGEVRVEKYVYLKCLDSFRHTLSVSVPNICLSCEEDGRKSVKTLKLKQQKKKESEPLEDVDN